MQRYLIRRILQMIPLLFFLSILIFLIMFLMPGDPIDMMVMGNPNLKAEDIARLKKVWGFDDPFPVRYYKWLRQAVLHGDLGFSYHWKVPVIQIVGERLPNTLVLMTASLLLSLLIAVPLGIFSARRQYSFADYLLTVFAFIGQAMPTFWFGLMMILVFSIFLKNSSGGPLLPPGGMMDIGSTASIFSWGRLKYLIMPAFVLGLHNITSWMKIYPFDNAGGYQPGLYQNCQSERPEGTRSYLQTRFSQRHDSDDYFAGHVDSQSGWWRYLDGNCFCLERYWPNDLRFCYE